MQEGQYIDRYLKINEVLDLVKFSRAKLYRLIKQGNFPSQRKIGHSARWVLSEVYEWMRNNPIAVSTKRAGVPRRKLEKHRNPPQDQPPRKIKAKYRKTLKAKYREKQN